MAKPEPSGLVNCVIKAGGSELKGEFQIYSVNIYNEINKIPTAVIKLLDGDPAQQKFEINEKADIEPGKDIEILAGFDTDAKTIFKGMITKLGVKICTGQSFTTIECKDKAIKMTIERNSEIYEKKKDSDIFKALISDAGATAGKIDATTYKHPQIVQYDTTNWDFLVSRAELNGLVVVTKANEVGAVKPKIAGPKLELEYGTNILEFNAGIDALSQLEKVKASAWDFKKQEVVENTASSAEFDDTGNLGFSKLAGHVKSKGFSLFHSGALEKDELKDWGTSKLLKSKMAKLQGSVKCEGSIIEPGDTLELKGISQRFNGKVFVSGVAHEVSFGHWFTTIQFGLSKNWHSETYSINAQETSGLLPSMNGLHIGVVKNIHEDPDKEERIQVSLPVLGSKVDIWARKTYPYAGKKRGVYFVPEVGDEVIISFLNDDARFPIILGSLHCAKNTPPYKTDAKNKEKGIVTKSELKITFDDEDKIITIETPGSNKMIFDDKEKKVTVSDKKGNTFEMTESEVTIESKGKLTLKAAKEVTIQGQKIIQKADTDIDIKGVNIKSKASAQYKIAADAKVEIKSSAMAEVKAGAIMIIKGALVKIN